MIAVIKTGGKQYLVEEGQTLSLETLAKEPGESVSFETLLLVDGDKVKVGTPVLGMNVTGEIVTHGRAKKIEVVKYKAKSRYTRRVGHRQNFTKVKITKIA
jgi:large subunit ribosomal protein L21